MSYYPTNQTEKQSDEGDEDNGVEPIHVKPRHLQIGRASCRERV